MRGQSSFASVGFSLVEQRVQVCLQSQVLEDQPNTRFSGIFFVLPCIESYQKVDLRTITLGVPPQEVRKCSLNQNLSLRDFRNILTLRNVSIQMSGLIAQELIVVSFALHFSTLMRFSVQVLSMYKSVMILRKHFNGYTAHGFICFWLVPWY